MYIYSFLISLFNALYNTVSVKAALVLNRKKHADKKDNRKEFDLLTRVH